MSKVISTTGIREGRGYSLGELAKSGLSLSQARALKIILDTRRRSAHDFNVEELKKMKIPEKKIHEKKAAPKKAAPEKEKAEKKPEVKEKKLVPLTEIKGVGAKRAEKLIECGLNSANALIDADLKELSEKTGISLKTLEKYLEEAKKVV